ncbi:hypothetical protein BV509_15075 [Rhodovulum sulfidophilum]|nr:hypothetical protein BV509_15075 [Rhodovulum sulfidophilum]
MTPITGGCLCGAIRLVASGPPLRVGICHCPDCRKQHGAVFYAAAIFPEAAVAIQGDPSHDRGRYFCPVCGASVCAKSGDEIEVHLGTLDTPVFSFKLRDLDYSPRKLGADRRGCRAIRPRPRRGRRLAVTSREIVDARPEQLGSVTLPVLEGCDGGSPLRG